MDVIWSYCKILESYLEGRQQQVKVGNATSGKRKMGVGSLQGAILSPLLFILYISDFNLWIDEKSAGYADVTSVFHFAKNLLCLIHTLENSADKVLQFMASNHLIANESKT